MAGMDVGRLGNEPISDKESLALLREEAKRLGRTPTIKDLNSPYARCKSEGFYRNRFGSVKEAFRRAGLNLRQRGHRADIEPPPIDPEKARAVTEQKKQFWLRQGAA